MEIVHYDTKDDFTVIVRRSEVMNQVFYSSWLCDNRFSWEDEHYTAIKCFYSLGEARNVVKSMLALARRRRTLRTQG